jgi:acyl-CoA reductase-like NAD-dependent aldehyde dehydrogenase
MCNPIKKQKIMISAETITADTKVDNFINGELCPPKSNSYMSIECPSTSEKIGNVAISNKEDVDDAVTAAHQAFQSWSKLTIKARAAIMLKFHALVQAHAQELAELIVKENGKNITEALADVAKGNETVEYACSLPQLAQGKILRVSSEVICQDRRDALGVVASIVPFNFPFMVPMWTLPIALVCGNTVVLKPSEKVPLTLYKTIELLQMAGIPDGVVNFVQGTKEAVEALIDHPLVRLVILLLCFLSILLEYFII